MLYRERRRTDRFDARVSDRAQTLQRVLKSLEKMRANKYSAGEDNDAAGALASPECTQLPKANCESEIFNLETRKRQLELILNARQLRLLSELQSIYPISKITGMTGGLSSGSVARQIRHQCLHLTKD